MSGSSKTKEGGRWCESVVGSYSLFDLYLGVQTEFIFSIFIFMYSWNVHFNVKGLLWGGLLKVCV